MKKLLLIAALAVFSIPATYANGDYDEGGGDDNSVRCNGRGSCATTTNNIDKSKTFNKGGEGGTGIGIGIGKGGDAKAYGGDADAEAYAKSIGINYNSLTTKQQTSIKNYVSSSNAQGQGQVGIVKNVGPAVVIEDHSVVTYEAAASSAIAPDMNAPDPTAQCRFSQGFSIAGSGVVASGSIGHSTSEYDPICGAWMASSQTTGNAKTVATTVAYCLTMDEAGIDVAQCEDWKGKVARGLGDDGKWVSAPANVAKVEEAETLAFVGGMNGSDGR